MSASFNLTGYQFGGYAASRTGGTGISAEPQQSQGALAELSDVYRQIGYEAGYSTAIRDHLEAFVATAEEVLRRYPATIRGDRSARQLLYSFISRLERQLDPVEQDARDAHDFVEGGLGI
jgi:hypothetical protein